MKYPVVYKARVKEDVKSSVFWYDSQQKGLGEEFLASLEDAIEKIQYNPFTYPKIPLLSQCYRHKFICL